MRSFSLHWMATHKWALLLGGIVLLLIISPMSEVYDRRDDVITPMTAGVLLAVTYGLGEKRSTLLSMTTLILCWFIISVFTEGSGLFIGKSVLAPVLFMFLLFAIFILLAQWLI